MKKILLPLIIFSFSLFADNPPNLLPEDPESSKSLFVGGSEFDESFKKMFWALGALVVLIFITVWMIKRLTKIRLTQFNRFSKIKIIEKRSLSPKSILYLVEIGGRRFFLSESQLEVRNLETLPHLTEIPESETDPSKMDLSKIDPSKMEPSKTAPPKMEPPKMEPPKVDPSSKEKKD